MSRTSDSGDDALATIPEVSNCHYCSQDGVFFIGDYSLQRYLATGGEASVFLGCDTGTNQQVAILNIKNLAEAEDRIQIHRRVNDIPGVVRLLKVIRIDQPKYKNVTLKHMNEYADFITKRAVFLITNYVAGRDCITFMK